MNSRQIDLIQKDCSEVFRNPIELDKLKDETLLICGGSGFIGSWLLEAINYLNTNHSFNTSVYVLAPEINEFQGKYPHLFQSKLIKTIEKDIRQLAELPSEITYIIHAAATPDNRVHLSNPLSIIDTIVNGTNRLLEVATLLPDLKKFLYLSSGLIYGRHGVDLSEINEDTVSTINCATMTSAYAEAKRMAETITQVYRSQYRIPVVTLRPFAFVGPYQHLDRPWAINNFLNDAINGSTIKILGNENTIRSYMYPSDMVLWILKSLSNGVDGLTLNLGSAEGKTLREVAHTISQNISTQPSIYSSPAQQNSKVTCFVPSIAKANKTLNLDITVDFERAIQKTIHFFQLKD